MVDEQDGIVRSDRRGWSSAARLVAKLTIVRRYLASCQYTFNPYRSCEYEHTEVASPQLVRDSHVGGLLTFPVFR